MAAERNGHIVEQKSFTEELGSNLSFAPNEKLQSTAHVSSLEQYKTMHNESITDPETFWGRIANEFYFKEKWQPGKFMDYNFDATKGKVFVKFMENAKTNISYNVLDRIVYERKLGDRVAFYWEGNDPTDAKIITYKDLLVQVCKFANVLKAKGVKKGDRVAIYMPMVIELVVAMLACARIGAIHSIVFAGFSADSLAERMKDGNCCLLITADGTQRGTKLIELKSICDAALEECRKSGLQITSCIVLRHVSSGVIEENGTQEQKSPVSKKPKQGYQVSWNSTVDCWWGDLMEGASEECECEWMDAEDPLFILYTSGSTGKPKGVLHTTAGYMLYTATTFKYTFDYHDNDIYWCTADIGWITGHSYVTYGPMANAATSVIFEGTPTYPDSGRFWAIVDKYKVTQFYTAPTAIRMLMKFGKEPVTRYSRSSLKVLGTVGEPINPEAWLWYYKVVGDERCAIADTFWQTETGGHVIVGLPGAITQKPGAASFPFFGVVPTIVNEDGKEITPCSGEHGYLVFKQPWPGMMRTLYNNHDRYESAYFMKFNGYYCAGDGAYQDSDGYYWVTGRIDDLMNVSGHLLSTAEIESAIVEHSSVAEAAVVSFPHDIKGNGIYCFVTPKEGITFTDSLKSELVGKVRSRIGPLATPDVIQHAPGLPKTRSGKIMRRVLRKIAVGDKNIGDVTTMADANVVNELFSHHPKMASNGTN